jgi:hypothetical protein
MCLRTLREGIERQSDVLRARKTASQGRGIFRASARKIFLTDPLLRRMEETKISRKTAMGIFATALFVDGVQAILTLSWFGIILNPIISLGAAYIFNRWFKIYGIHLFSKDNMGLFWGTIAAELIPFFDALPVWTTSVAITLVRNARTRAEF